MITAVVNKAVFITKRCLLVINNGNRANQDPDVEFHEILVWTVSCGDISVCFMVKTTGWLQKSTHQV